MKALSSGGTVHRRPLIRPLHAMLLFLLTLSLAAYAIVTPSAAHAADTLLSQGKTTTASSTENAGTVAADATDGNTGTRWSSAFSDPQWLQVDLGATATVDKVVLNWEAAYATAFQIQTSNDGTNWAQIYSTTTGTGGDQTLTVSGSGRYIRLYGTARATQYGYSLWEFQVYGTTGSGGGGCGTTNAALNQTATASSTENAGTPASAAVDGNTGTRWSSAFNDPQWLQVDLGSTQSICQVVLNWETASGKAYQIQTSNDGTNWAQIYTTTTGPGGTETLNVSGSGRYIRMYGTARNTAYGYSLWEFQVFTGSGGGGTGVTVTNPGNQNTTVGTAVNLQIQASDSTAGQTLAYSAAGLPTGLSINAASGLISGTPSTIGSYGTTVTVKDGTGAIGTASFTWAVTAIATGCTNQPATPDFGPNVHIFDPSMSSASIQTTLDTVFTNQKLNQFGTERDALLFKPGTYSNTANIGYYTSIQGLGQNPDDVTINGDVTVDAFDGTGNATQNFWRSAENLAVNPSAGNTRWAVAQAGPFRRMDIHGGLQMYPASYGYASGGYVADSKISGQASSVSQQQWYTQDSSLGSWSGSVWNMVFSGVTGAPAQSFPNPPMTTLATTPVSRDVPYLYVDSSGAYRVFLPSLRTNATGPSWANGPTPGTSLPISQFFVVTPSNTAAQMNAALAQGCSLFFTPGVYTIDQTLNVSNPNTVVLGTGFPTLIPANGVTTMQVADVDGVRISGLLMDAGTTNSPSLLTVGTQGSSANHSTNPISVQDVFFRIGGDIAGKATDSLVVNANNTLVNDIWAWRADHGNANTVGWTTNTADNGLTVNGNNVLATGLFVEHYQKNEVVWNGQGGETIFFQNENPYDPPNQAAWMNGSTNGYPAYKVASNVTSHQAYGMGSYCYFNVNPAVVNDHAFEAPTTSGVQFHDLLTVSLGGVGVISHVINSTGAATPSNTTPSNVTSYP